MHVLWKCLSKTSLFSVSVCSSLFAVVILVTGQDWPIDGGNWKSEALGRIRWLKLTVFFFAIKNVSLFGCGNEPTPVYKLNRTSSCRTQKTAQRRQCDSWQMVA